jgi:hypothetical protein
MNFGGIKLGNQEPFVGIRDETVIYGGKLYGVRRFLIQGKIVLDQTNCQKDILQDIYKFSKTLVGDFQSLSAGGFTAEKARCESFSILNSTVFGAEYSAEFLAYPENWFSDIVRVADPIDNVSVVENKDGSISVNRRVSGRGIADTPEGGVGKVRTWIESLNLEDIPQNIGLLLQGIGQAPSGIKPSSFRQVVNRLDGSISVDVEFKFNQNSQSVTFLSVSIESSEDKKTGTVLITVQGSLSGPQNMQIETLREEFKKIPIQKYAQDIGSNGQTIDPRAINFSVDEDELNNTITFSYTFNNISIEKLILSETTADHDVVNDIRTISVNGTATFQKKHQKDRQTDINQLNQFDTPLNISCQGEYTKYFDNVSPPPVFTLPKSSSITTNSSNFSTNFNVSFDDSSLIPPNLQDQVFNFEYTVDYTPSIPIKNPLQFLNGSQGIVDIKAKTRGEVTIQGTALSEKEDLESQVLQAAQEIYNQLKGSESFANEFLQKKTCAITKDTTVKYDFELQYSAETKLYGG